MPPKNCNEGNLVSASTAQSLMNAYKTFLDNIAKGKSIGLLDLSRQPKYLKIGREAVENILENDECGGLGIALALTQEHTGNPQFTLVVGPLKGDKCEFDINDIKLYEDLGQGDSIAPGHENLTDSFNKFLQSLK